MFIIVGLGNPGTKYRGTKHNVGFDTIDCLADRNNSEIKKIKHRAIYGETKIGNEKALLVKPQTYMNNSGESVIQIINYYKIPVENVIVVYDDIDIEPGTLRVRPKGSAGSHNGMKSIINHLQDDKFPRVRIGIGKKKEGYDLAHHVLSGFDKDERVIVDEAIERAAKAVETIITDSVNKAMNEYNG